MKIANEIKKLKAEVTGHYGLIAERAGVTKTAVGHVLNGAYYNEEVINAAIYVRDSLRKKNANLLKKLTK